MFTETKLQYSFNQPKSVFYIKCLLKVNLTALTVNFTALTLNLTAYL